MIVPALVIEAVARIAAALVRTNFRMLFSAPYEFVALVVAAENNERARRNGKREVVNAAREARPSRYCDRINDTDETLPREIGY
jgi:hypothetical protein